MKMYALSLFLFSVNTLFGENALKPDFTGNNYIFLH